MRIRCVVNYDGDRHLEFSGDKLNDLFMSTGDIIFCEDLALLESYFVASKSILDEIYEFHKDRLENVTKE